jgi:hypothetical protein
METRRAVNPAMPASLVWAQVALYVGAAYAVARGLAEPRFPAWEILIGLWQLLAAYGIANERRWGWRLGMAAAVASVLPALGQLARSPVLVLRPDFVVLIAIPFFTVCALGEPSARDFTRAWFR